jgi:hypothetical protein
MEYRYQLSRNWNGAGKIVNFIMLNPSTADDRQDDATIRRCIGFAKLWGFSGLTVTNLFAMRATDPRALLEVPPETAVGTANDEMIGFHAEMADAVVLAWGDWEMCGRDVHVLRIVQGCPLFCIGMTKSGNPLHPVRAPYGAIADYPLRAFTAPALPPSAAKQ